MAPVHMTTTGEAECFPSNGRNFTLEELQVFVEGYIEVIDFHKGQMVVNEEGVCLDLPINLKASQLIGRCIYGPVLYIPKEDSHYNVQ